MTSKTLKSDFTYLGQLVDAAWSGAHAASPSRPVAPEALCLPAILGSALGALAAVLQRRRKGAHVGISAIIGGAVGLCAGAVWENRAAMSAVARSAAHEVNTARDMHWLQNNPIAYG